MTRTILALFATLALSVSSGFAQDGAVGAGRFEIGAFPGGAMFFTESGNGNEPEFGNYALGGSVTYNLNRWIGMEGEGGGTLGVRQNFTSAATAFSDYRTPGMWMYSGNLVVNPRRERSCLRSLRDRRRWRLDDVPLRRSGSAGNHSIRDLLDR